VQYWPVFELDTSAFIGCCGLQPYRPEEKICALGYHLLPAYWGKGYATEAARAVLDYARTKLALQAIFAGHHPDHNASRHVLLKLGFEQIGDEFYPPTGLFHSGYMLQLANLTEAKAKLVPEST
jgi:ribosomal-protein-alanine N-acetyltransferase